MESDSKEPASSGPPDIKIFLKQMQEAANRELAEQPKDYRMQGVPALFTDLSISIPEPVPGFIKSAEKVPRPKPLTEKEDRYVEQNTLEGNGKNVPSHYGWIPLLFLVLPLICICGGGIYYFFSKKEPQLQVIPEEIIQLQKQAPSA